MSVRDTKLNVRERHKTRRKGDGLGPRDLSSERESLVTWADSGEKETVWDLGTFSSWREDLVTKTDRGLSGTTAKVW